MICDRLFFKGQTILTIFHKGIINEQQKRRIKKSTKIGRFNLEFTEEYLDDTVCYDDFKDTWVQKEVGFLPPKSTLNPYNCSTCAQMTRYCFLEKPSSIFEKNGNEYSLKPSAGDFDLICAFIKKYTGIDIKSSPMALGDLYFFEPHGFELQSNEKESIILQNVPSNSLIVIHFKKDELIVFSRVIKTDESDSFVSEFEIKCDNTWSNFDIEIFKNNQLIFIDKDVGFIRSIEFRTSTTLINKRIPLNAIGTEYTMNKTCDEHVTHIGKQLDTYHNLMQKSEHEIKRQLEQAQPDDKVNFIKPNQMSKVLKIIGGELESATDEFWLFDSYFFNEKNGINSVIDWLRIIANCDSKSKNIVFSLPNNESSFEQLLDSIINDTTLSAIKRKKRALGIKLYYTPHPIHDRFILGKSKNQYQGLFIGTSFNSLDKNYYCILKLSHAASKSILDELILWIDEGNAILYKDI